jgi:hypothetical protein
MRFSQRIGQTGVRQKLQGDALDQATRNRLWNVISRFIEVSHDSGWGSSSNSTALRIFIGLNHEFFKQKINSLPSPTKAIGQVETFVDVSNWHQVYDLIEFLGSFSFAGYVNSQERFRADINVILSEELASYRFVGRVIAPITDPIELETVKSISEARVAQVGSHFREAVALLADRTQRDFRNCVKEAVSGVEAAARVVSDQENATLGDALKVLKAEAVIHPALEGTFLKLYGYASDAAGIRHALPEKPEPVSRDLAKMLLVTCAAFAHYLLSIK